MAQVTISRQFPDGDLISVHVAVKESFPDSIAECKRAAIDAYGEAFAAVTTALALVEDDE